MLKQYYQDDITVLRQACRVFGRDIMQIRKLYVFLEAITIASPCNKVMRKRFLQPDTPDLIPTSGYTCNKNYSKKAMMWLLHMEETDDVKTMHGRNGHEYKLHELPHFSVDGYCPDTGTI